MGSALQFSPPSLIPTKLQCNFPSISSSNRSSSFRISNRRQLCSLISPPGPNLEASWIQTEGSSNDDLGGWAGRKKPEIESRNGIPKFVLAGIGASVAAVLAAVTYFSFSKRGFKFQLSAPFQSFNELLMPSKSIKVMVEDTASPVPEVNQSPETNVDDKLDRESDLSKPKVSDASAGDNKHIIVPITADPIQQEALDVLKRLKIVENDASAGELCTRREYARWFVKVNSMLERNPKHKIVPMILLAGSTVSAFDDVSTSDPDFKSIQALGEAGIIFSKLSAVNSNLADMGNSDSLQKFEFCPESFISRFDLVNWKAMLEYPFSSEAKEKILRMKVGILDLPASNSDASPQLLMDLMAGDKSIVRRIFGNIRLLQPKKPVTKAQAAVALTSGRMADKIHSEISRLEAENQSRLVEMEEIRSELIRRGDIQRIWEERLNKEKERSFEAERAFQIVLLELKKEKIVRDEGLAQYTKDKTALDYQQQLLVRLRKEVDGMYDRLVAEKVNNFAEQHSLEMLIVDLSSQQDAMVEAKLILEAEKEALRILRYWVEEEARKIQERGKFLEQATQRWKWN